MEAIHVTFSYFCCDFLRICSLESHVFKGGISTHRVFKVSVNENFSTLLDFVFFGFLS